MVVLGQVRPSGAPAGAWWHYVDEARTHHVVVEWREGDRTLLVREGSPGSAEMAERHSVAQPWETRLALWLLEARLAHLGRYWRQRSHARGWSLVTLPRGAPALDPRACEALAGTGAVALHHYHDERGRTDRLLAALAEPTPDRYLVLRADLDAASLDVRRLDVLQRAVPAPLMRSLLARERMPLVEQGVRQLVTREDYERAFGAGGEARARRLVREVLEHARDGRRERPRARASEEEEFQELLVRLSDPRLLALHHRFLAADEEDHLLAAGPLAIRKAIAAKRDEAEHTQQHLLTILEASLLAREKQRCGTLVPGEPEVRALTRLAYYL